MDTGEFSAGGNLAMAKHLVQGGSRIIPSLWMPQNVQIGPLSLWADFTLPYLPVQHLMLVYGIVPRVSMSHASERGKRRRRFAPLSSSPVGLFTLSSPPKPRLDWLERKNLVD